MSKNTSTLESEDGQYYDWIEFYNPNPIDIDLSGYGLSDDKENIRKWVFPEITIAAQGYLVVFASNADNPPINEVHSNFQISREGESLILTDDAEVVIDQTQPIELSSNKSYLRIPDGSPLWYISDFPSPGQSNSYSNSLTFSHSEGFYEDSFMLSIESLNDDQVYYTIDGSIPTPNDHLFTQSIPIIDRTQEPNVLTEHPTTPPQDLTSFKAWEAPSSQVPKGTIIRVASFRDGERTSKIYTQSYFVNLPSYDVPVVSLTTEANNFFHPDSGIYIPGNAFNPAEAQLTGNYHERGENWERALHIDYFSPDGNLKLSQDCGVRIHGGASRIAAQKSLRLYARKEYSEPAFNINVFPGETDGSYKRIILRSTLAASWGTPTTLKNSCSQVITTDLNLDLPRVQTVIVFLNGEYWGIHELQDRIDEHFLAKNHSDVDKDSIEFKENWFLNENYDQLIAFIEQNDLSLPENYQYILDRIDLSNYIDYQIAEQFFANYDWPGNNMRAWREKPDGKWRWIFFDLDAGFTSSTYNMLEHAALDDPSVTWPNFPASTFLFRNMIKNEKFQHAFISRYSEILCKVFGPGKTIPDFELLYATNSTLIEAHCARWNYPPSKTEWEDATNEAIRSFLSERPQYVRQNIQTFFNLDNPIEPCPTATSDEHNFLVYPNPSRGSISLLNEYEHLDNVQLKIFSSNGILILSDWMEHFAKYETKHFNLRTIPSGTYIVKISSNRFSEYQKLVIIP